MLMVTNMPKYRYLFHAFHDHFTLYIIGEETFTSYRPKGLTVLDHRLDHQNRRMDHPFVMLCLCYEFWVLKNNHQFLRHCSSESEPFLTKLNKSSLVGNELFDKSLPCIVNLTFVLALHFMKVQGQVIEFHRLDLNCFHVKQQKRVSS